MNPLQLLPAKVRLTCYAIYGVLALAATAAGQYFAALHQDSPDWLIGGGAALVPVGAAFAAVAASNVNRKDDSTSVVVDVPADVSLRETPLYTSDDQLNRDTTS